MDIRHQKKKGFTLVSEDESFLFFMIHWSEESGLIKKEKDR